MEAAHPGEMVGIWITVVVVEIEVRSGVEETELARLGRVALKE